MRVPLPFLVPPRFDGGRVAETSAAIGPNPRAGFDANPREKVSIGAQQTEEGLTGIPEFKFVVVSYNGNIKMEESLDAALAAIFGGVVQPDPGDGELPSDVAELVSSALQALEDADAALRAGDLAQYQAKVDEAARLLSRAEELAAEAVGAGG